MQYVAIYRGSKAYVVLKSTTFVEGSSVHTRLAAPQHTVRGPRPSVRQLGPRDGGLKGEELCDPDEPVSTMGCHLPRFCSSAWLGQAKPQHSEGRRAGTAGST